MVLLAWHRVVSLQATAPGNQVSMNAMMTCRCQWALRCQQQVSEHLSAWECRVQVLAACAVVDSELQVLAACAGVHQLQVLAACVEAR